MKRHLHLLWLITCTLGPCCYWDFGGVVASLNSICCIGVQLCYRVVGFLERQKKYVIFRLVQKLDEGRDL